MNYFHPFLVERVCSILFRERGNGVTIRFTWQEKYTEAMLELNREELPRRIDAAEKAIYQRVQELKSAGATSAEELWAINDALRGLRVLAKTECSPQPSPQAGAPQSEVAS
jgi:hypothetical protein